MTILAPELHKPAGFTLLFYGPQKSYRGLPENGGPEGVDDRKKSRKRVEDPLYDSTKICSGEMLRDRIDDYNGATGARRLVGARPVEHGVRELPRNFLKNNGEGQGGLPPWVASPPGGERG